MNKINWTAIGAIAAVVSVLLYFFPTDSNTNVIVIENNTNIIKKKFIQQTPLELINWYKNIKHTSSELDAYELSKNKFIGQNIQIRGKITEIQGSFTGLAIITINTKNNILVFAHFKNSKNILTFKKGKLILINGKISTLDENFIALESSVIIN